MVNLKNTRKGYQSALAVLKTVILSEDPTTILPEDWNTCNEKLQKLTASLELNHQELVNSVADTDLDQVLTTYDAISVTVLEIQGHLNKCAAALRLKNEEKQTQERVARDAAQAAARTNPNPNPVTRKIKLPDLDLPSFSGKFQEWLPFKSLYTRIIHDRTDLSDAEKLTYLKSVLKGDAQQTIESVSLEDAEYGPAWQRICSKYQHSREIAFAQVGRILDCPALRSNSVNSQSSALNTVQNSLSALDSLKLPPEQLNSLFIVYTVINKMDAELKKEFRKTLNNSEIPSLQTVYDFLEKNVRDGCIENNYEQSTTHVHEPRNQQKSVGQSKPVSNRKLLCSFCKAEHLHIQCKKLLDKPISERLQFVRDHRVCSNCLSGAHMAKECQAANACKKCNMHHHTLLHRETSKPASQVAPTTATTGCGTASAECAFLPTAVGTILDTHKTPIQCRVVLDTGSSSTYMTAALATRLGLPRKTLSIEVEGLAGIQVANPKEAVEFTISSRVSKHTISGRAYILPKVTSAQPLLPLQPSAWGHIQNIQLADPAFHIPKGVDLLIGVDLYAEVISEGIIRGATKKEPIAQQTIFGWVVYGSSQSSVDLQNPSASCNMAVPNLEDTLQRFWDIEDCSTEQRKQTAEERTCEAQFEATTAQLENGSFEVSLPFKTSTPPLGNSLFMAKKRQLSLETRLSRSPALKKQYFASMQDMIDNGHMELVPSTELQVPDSEVYYLPHHPVIKETSSTTKLRIVFDASAKTSSGVSLNDKLMTGPVLQDDLFSILVRWRHWIIAMTSDIRQMYLYILVRVQDRNYQRILWRFDPSQPLTHYQIKKVTFGTASAPYQAIKTWRTLADTIQRQFPQAAAVMKRDFYVDDGMTGAATIEEALELQQQLLQASAAGNFVLRKWSSSDARLLQSLPEDMRETQVPFSLDQDDAIKALGLIWNPATDDFRFTVKLPANGKLTKRSVLSQIAQVFDPLGFLSPVTVRAKCIMQSLWKITTGWDATLPQDISRQWTEYRNELQFISSLRIPRCIMMPHASLFQLHGFSDASEKAYAAAVYLRSSYPDNTITVRLIASKHRVAPVKQISLPRLELCGADLLAALVTNVKTALPISIQEVYGWSDSTIVLHWITSPPQKWKTYVANRVTSIQEVIPVSNWNHVKGILNPADLPTRGMSVQDFLDDTTWFSGPEFLYDSSVMSFSRPSSQHSHEQSGNLCNKDPEGFAYNPSPDIPIDFTIINQERRHTATTMVATTISDELIQRYSDLHTLQRLVAWMLRWNRVTISKSVNPGPLTAAELQYSLLRLVWITQQKYYGEEVTALQEGSALPKNSTLSSFAPFIDQHGLLRVGGRLTHSELSYGRKHPLLLPRQASLTCLLVRHYHHRYYHAGPRLLTFLVQQQFWIPHCKQVVKSIINKCKACVLHKAAPMEQQMAPLPSSRVTPQPVFSHVGVDYAGPIQLKSGFGRNAKAMKAYIAIFVSFSVKAVHLELVSDLTTDAFLAALHRFIGRRGKPSHVYSDNGTNFVGANNELKELALLLHSVEHNTAVSRQLADDGIQWHFNPPAAPHMGGLWEAAVKSTKYHLRRVLGDTSLNFEEYATLLVGIEACLNSRPLCPLSSDPNELQALTPGHWLIGQPLVASPQQDITDVKVNRLSRWQHLQYMTQHFWRRWSQEYLQQLQKMTKWKHPQRNLAVGDLVAVREENLPPQKWRLARVSQLHQKSSNTQALVRTVTVKTADGYFTRPITKLSLLPLNDSEEK